MLTTTNRDANAVLIAGAVRQLCIDNVTDGARFEVALRQVGWPARQTQKANPEASGELDVWELPFATLVRSPRPVAERSWTCSTSVDGEAAPSEGRMIDALNGIAGGKRQSEEVGWQWKPSFFREVHMTLGTSSISNPQEMLVFVEFTTLPPLKALLGA